MAVPRALERHPYAVLFLCCAALSAPPLLFSAEPPVIGATISFAFLAASLRFGGVGSLESWLARSKWPAIFSFVLTLLSMLQTSIDKFWVLYAGSYFVFAFWFSCFMLTERLWKVLETSMERTRSRRGSLHTPEPDPVVLGTSPKAELENSGRACRSNRGEIRQAGITPNKMFESDA